MEGAKDRSGERELWKEEGRYSEVISAWEIGRKRGRISKVEGKGRWEDGWDLLKSHVILYSSK